MSFNFPTGATVGQEYVTGAGITYVYNGYGWAVKTTMTEAPVNGKIYGRKDASWAEIVADVNKSYVDTQDALRVAKSGDEMTGGLTIFNELRIRGGNGGVAVVRFTADDRYLYYNGTDFEFNGGKLRVNGDIFARYANRAGTYRFGDVDSDRYISHDGANTHWSGLGTVYCNAHLANIYNITASGTISAPTIATDGATMMGKSYAYIGWDNGGKGAIEVRSGDPGWDAFMTFHRPGAFATYFGLRTDNVFCFGGWSHGNNAWRFWTELQCGHPISNCYLPHAGDVYHGNQPDVTEPYGGAVATGAFSYGGGLRYRRLQVYTSSWWTVGYG